MFGNDNDKSKYLMISNDHNKIYNLFYFVSLDSSNVSINKFPDGSWENYFDLDKNLQEKKKDYNDYLESIEKKSTSKKDSVEKESTSKKDSVEKKLDKFTETYKSIIKLNENLNIEDYERCFNSFKNLGNEYSSFFYELTKRTNSVIDYLNVKELLDINNDLKAQTDFNTFIYPYRRFYKNESIPNQTIMIEKLFSKLIKAVDKKQKKLIHNVIIYIKNCIWGNNNEKIIFTANNQKSLYEILNKKNDNSEDDNAKVMEFNESIKPYESNTNNDYIKTYEVFSKTNKLDHIINIMETTKFERFLYKIENYVNKQTPL